MNNLNFVKGLALSLLISSSLMFAQNEGGTQEEVTVVGSQIKGASIKGARPTYINKDNLSLLNLLRPVELIVHVGTWVLTN